MVCTRCPSKRILYVRAKIADDGCYTSIYGNEVTGVVPSGLGIGVGDYIELSLCLDCGQVQAVFPLPETTLEKGPVLAEGLVDLGQDIEKPAEEPKVDFMKLLENS